MKLYIHKHAHKRTRTAIEVAKLLASARAHITIGELCNMNHLCAAIIWFAIVAVRC